MPSAFDPENALPVLVIQVTRLYDVMLAFLAAIDPEKATKVAEAHAAGLFLTDPPAFAGADDSS